MKTKLLIIILSVVSLSAGAKSRVNTLKMTPLVECQTKSTTWESPTDADRETIIRDSVEWFSYNKNGVTLQATCAKVKDYGRYHQLKLVIVNNSSEVIEFDPFTDIKGVVVVGHMYEGKRDMIDMEVISHADYIKKVSKAKEGQSDLAEASQRYLNQITINPSDSVAGYVNLRRTPKDKLISASVNIKGAEYIYNWNIVRTWRLFKR